VAVGGGSAILGGALLPHAPQFVTRPASEDAATIARVESTGARIGTELSALEPDIWITISNDHAQQFFLDCAPPFALHVGGEAKGDFAGKAFRHPVASEVSFALVRELYRRGFDPAFTSTAEVDYALGIPLAHLGVQGPIVPVFVNAYLPPQPQIERCHAFGQALAAALAGLRLRAVVVASGGMSHFPGTDRYSSPDTAFDEALLAQLRAGRLKALAGLSEQDLDDSGNIELRCWAVAAGMLGDRVPDVAEFNPSWHHNYASLGYWSSPAGGAAGDRAASIPHYPSTRPDLVALVGVLHALANHPTARAEWAADRAAFVARHALPDEHARLLLAGDFRAMVALGVHPLVPFLARLALEREGA
jgi:2,3-dihydroxyphenylpropionate 1,2-dioxygenase